MDIRAATPDDAPGISALLQALIKAGKRTSPGDLGFVMESYIEQPHAIRCSVAVDDDGTLLGFQVLLRAVEGNRFDTPVGWGIVGTHVSPLAARRGVGSRLFAETRRIAADAGLENLEAFIAMTNVEGQAYYEAMGFRTYRIADVSVCKCYRMG